jgi:hypothetical protein
MILDSMKQLHSTKTLEKKLKDVEEETVQKGPSTVNNSLFVGSTADLAKMLKEATKAQNK